MKPNEVMVSMDVTALFTSIPRDKALATVRSRLEKDNTLSERTKLSVEDIVQLTDECLKCTYFVYNNKFYQQTEGTAMGSPFSPMIANL